MKSTVQNTKYLQLQPVLPAVGLPHVAETKQPLLFSDGCDCISSLLVSCALTNAKFFDEFKYGGHWCCSEAARDNELWSPSHTGPASKRRQVRTAATLAS